MMDNPHPLWRSALARRVLWLLFAIVFYNAGLAITTLLLAPEAFEGGSAWLWVLVFPFLIPAFFAVNRHCGCAAGMCYRKDPGKQAEKHEGVPRVSGGWPGP